MTPSSRAALLHHALALDTVVVAMGIGYLVPGAPAVLYGAFLLAIIASTWKGGEEIGLAATAYSVVALALFFPTVADTTALFALAGAGAIVSAFARAVKRLRRGDQAAPIGEARPAERPVPSGLPFATALPLLVVVLYTNISDLAIRKFAVPSMLQPLILLLAVVVWRSRRELKPLGAALQPVILFFAIYGLVSFSTSIWAKDAALVDGRVTEIVKSLMIAVIAASLAFSWQTLERGLTALVIAATVLAGTSVVQIATGRFFDAFGGLVRPESGNIFGDYSAPRASGPPASDPNFYARTLLVAIPIAIGLAVAQRSGRRRGLYAAAAMVITAGTLATYSRGAMLALVAMAGLLLVALRVPPKNVVVAAIAGAVAIAFLPTDITTRFLSIESLLPAEEERMNIDNSLEKRKLLVGAAMRMFEAHPLTGVGAGHYGWHYVPYANEVGSSSIDFHRPGSIEHPHGLYVEAAAETGIFGLAALCGALLAALASAYRSNRALLRSGQWGKAAIAAGIGVGIAGYMLSSVVLHESELRYIALYFGFVIAVARLATGSAPLESGNPT